MVGRIRVSMTFAAGQKSEICRYEDPCEVSLPGQAQFSHPLTPHRPSQTHTHGTHCTNTSHRHITCTRQNTRTTCTTHTRTHRNHTSPGPHTSIAVTLAPSQHTHMQHKQQYMHHSHRNNRTHNIGYYVNLTNRPRTTTGLQTPHKHTGPAVKVREISSYCKST